MTNHETKEAMNDRMTRKCLAAVACTGMMLAAIGHAAEPLRALMITGGCCHDYETQKKILSEGISARANVSWTIVHEGGDARAYEVSVYKNPDWTKGYDVVLHNECFGHVTNSAFVEQIARGHAGGVGAVVIHCSMHSYRMAETDEWRKLLGITSMRHQQHVAIEVENLKPEHPVMKGFPEKWKTPKGELYEVDKIWPNTIPLGQAFGVRTKNDHVCIWVNTYEKARVFGTTLGHFNEEMESEVFLDLVTRGLLWASNKLDDNGQPKPGYGPPARKKPAP